MRRSVAFRTLWLAVLLAMLLSAVLGLSSCNGGIKPKNRIFYGYFDTVSTIYDYSGASDADFSSTASILEAELRRYHELFDIYNTYDGVVNLASVNASAGEGAVKVSPELIDFLEYAISMHELTDGYVNIAMGAVLSIWHEFRDNGNKNPEAAKLPSAEALSLAAEHCDINDVLIDRENSTVELLDSEMSLDVGAIGKGYAAQRLADVLEARSLSGYVIDIGGNLCAVGTKPDGSGWNTGIKNPNASSNDCVYTFTLSDSSAVTSGGYERFYTVNGKKYHHIIDKDTLMPAEHFASVSVICGDSALADALSTALFCMDYTLGASIVSSISGVDAVWVYADGKVVKSFD